jgi:hypothetical protein
VVKTPLQFVCNVVIPLLAVATSTAIDANEWIPYSYNGTVETGELATIQNLAWPQSYEAITSCLGYPSYRSETADWYLRTGGMGRVRIDYDPNTNTAISYALEGN